MWPVCVQHAFGHPPKGWGPAGVSSPRGSSLLSDHGHPHCSPSRSVLRVRVADGAWPQSLGGERRGQLGRLLGCPPPPHPTSLWGLRRQK